MKNILKILKWVAVGLVALIVILGLAVVFLPKLLNVDSVKNYLVDVAQKQVNRKITLEKVSFSVFTGLELHNLTMSDDPKFSNGTALKIKRLVLSYDLWPLIFERKVKISQAGIDGLSLLFEQRGAATNFDSLAPATTQEVKKQTQQKVVETQPAVAAAPVSFDVKKIFIKGADIKYVFFFLGVPTGMDIKDMNFEVTNLNNDLEKNPANISSTMKLVFVNKVTKLSFSGKLLASNRANVVMNMDVVDGDALMEAFYPPALIKILSAGKPYTIDDMLDQSLAMDFTPLKNFHLSFTGKLGSYLYQKVNVQNIELDTKIDNLQCNADMKYQLYSGTGTLNFKSLLNRPDARYAIVSTMRGVESQGYLRDAFGITDFMRGSLNADLVANGNLLKAYRLNGKLQTVVSDGAIMNPEKLLNMANNQVLASILGNPEVVKTLKNSGFKTLQMNMNLDRTMPSLTYIKGTDRQGKVFMDIDFTKDFTAEIKNQAQQAVQKEVDKVKDQAQKDLDEAKKREEERLKKEAEDQLKKMIKF